MAYAVGEVVWAEFGNQYFSDVREGVVIGVTPKGRVNVQFARRKGETSLKQFTKSGKKVGGSSDFYQVTLIDKADALNRIKKKQVKEALQYFHELIRDGRASDKAGAIALADRITRLAHAIPEQGTDNE